jgi:hypothetical protein
MGADLGRAALVRVFGGGNGRKTDDTDAESIALVGLHSTDLPHVRADELTVTLRLLSNRRNDLVGLRTQAVCRIHRDTSTTTKHCGAREGKWGRLLRPA